MSLPPNDPLTRAEQVQAGSWRTLFSSCYIWRAVAVTGGAALYAINVLIVATIMPSIVDDIGGVDYYAWSTTLFVVASIFGSALAVFALSRLGARGTYLGAMLVFMLGSLACALAPDMFWLLLGRAAQGAGGGILVALSYTLIRQMFEPVLWPRAIALVSAMWGIATLCGPAIGGIFAQYGVWRWSFGALLPVALVQALIVIRQLGARQGPNVALPKPGNQPHIPWATLLLLVLSSLVVAASSLQTQRLWLAALGCMGGVLIGIAACRMDSKSAGGSILPAATYRRFSILAAIYICIWLMQAGQMVEIYIPYFLQHIHGFGPLGAGYMTAIMAGGWSAASLVSSGRRGSQVQRMLCCGAIICAVSLAALAALLPWVGLAIGSGVHTAFIILALAGAGFGMGAMWPHLISGLMTYAPEDQASQASAAATTMQLYAMSIGSAFAGFIVNAAGLHAAASNTQIQNAAFWLLALFTVLPCMAVYWSWQLVHRMRECASA